MRGARRLAPFGICAERRGIVAVRISEVQLGEPQEHAFLDGRTVQCKFYRERDGTYHLSLSFPSGNNLDLPRGIDSSELLDCPRIFVLESARSERVIFLGGEFAFWVSRDGVELDSMSIFREWGLEEYYDTEFFSSDTTTYFIYELGVLALEEDLRVLWHRYKLINDFFRGMEDGFLKFARDHDHFWLMNSADGSGYTAPES